MADGADLTIDSAKLSADGDRIVRQYLTAGTKAVAGATKGLERALEAATQRSVPGKLWKAWASRSDPKSGPSRNPTGRVFVNGSTRTRGAINFWTKPGTVRGKGGKYLAIPLPAAGSRGRDRALTPLQWEARHNTDLNFVPRPGRAPLLVADMGRLNARGTFSRLSLRQIKAGKRGAVWVPIFVLIPMQKHANTVAVEPLVRVAQTGLVREYLSLAGQR